MERIVEDLRLPQEVVEQPHPGRGNRTELEYRLAWARTYLKNYGLITNSARGVWALTPRGLEQQTVDPHDVVRFVRERSVRERRGQAEPTEIADSQVEPEAVEDETAS